MLVQTGVRSGQRIHQLLLLVFTTWATLLGGCGVDVQPLSLREGGGGGVGGADGTGSKVPAQPIAGGQPEAGAGHSGSQPTPSNDVDAATFLIGITFITPAGQVTQAFGTGFAVEENIIATNAHVTAGVLEQVRDFNSRGWQFVEVAAYQSETGQHFNLLRAIVHPSYAGSTRSADVGLFITRESLPTTLPLALPEETTGLRKGDELQLNGFPGNVFELVNSVTGAFDPRVTVPRASLYTGTIQAIENFDSRVLVDLERFETVDMYQHSMDTEGGTSGSPILYNGAVVAVHNSGAISFAGVYDAAGRIGTAIVKSAAASWGVHVRHLHNLIDDYHRGVLLPIHNFTLPPGPELVRVGVSESVVAPENATAFRGTVASPSNPNLAHDIEFEIQSDGSVTGTTRWPENPSLGYPARTYRLQGALSATGLIELQDNTPEVNPGWRRGIYKAAYNPANPTISGEYYELNESTDELTFYGAWSASR